MTKGVSANMLKISSKRRRTLKQIKAEKEVVEEAAAEMAEVEEVVKEAAAEEVSEDSAEDETAAESDSESEEDK